MESYRLDNEVYEKRQKQAEWDNSVGDYEDKNINIQNNNSINNTKDKNFLDDIKSDIIDANNTVKKFNKENERKEFLKMIDGNKDELIKLSIGQLKKLDKYYDKVIENNQIKIKKASN